MIAFLLFAVVGVTLSVKFGEFWTVRLGLRLAIARVPILVSVRMPSNRRFVSDKFRMALRATHFAPQPER